MYRKLIYCLWCSYFGSSWLLLVPPVPLRSLPFPSVPFLAPVPPGFPGGLSFRSFWFLPVYPPLPQPFIRPSFHKHRMAASSPLNERLITTV